MSILSVEEGFLHGGNPVHSRRSPLRPGPLSIGSSLPPRFSTLHSGPTGHRRRGHLDLHASNPPQTETGRGEIPPLPLPQSLDSSRALCPRYVVPNSSRRVTGVLERIDSRWTSGVKEVRTPYVHQVSGHDRDTSPTYVIRTGQSRQGRDTGTKTAPDGVGGVRDLGCDEDSRSRLR